MSIPFQHLVRIVLSSYVGLTNPGYVLLEALPACRAQHLLHLPVICKENKTKEIKQQNTNKKQEKEEILKFEFLVYLCHALYEFLFNC